MAEVDWTVLTIGHLSVNKYWGETERQRQPLCTSTLLQTTAGILLIDPSLPPHDMPALLRDQAGITAEEVAAVFLTHFHGDHRAGLEAFPNAQWLMAPVEIAYQRTQGDEAALLDRIQPAENEIAPGVWTMRTPGHTPGHTALRFTWRNRRVVVAADAAMTEAFFRARDGYHNSTDMAQVRESICLLETEADIVIPGHGNYFVTAWPPAEKPWR